MKTSQDGICTEIKRREKKGQPVIYWRERIGNRMVLREKYWGKVPTEKMDKLLRLINNSTRGNRVKICKMVGLKIDDLPQSHLKNTEFLKRDVIAKLHLKEKSRLAGAFDKRRKANRHMQQKHPKEPILDYINCVVKADAESVEVLEENPMEKWESFYLSSFVSNSKRIHDLHEKATRLLLEKGNRV
jgi:hypothetical protein